MTSVDTCGPCAIVDNFCAEGHDLKQLIVYRFFNCIAKNAVKELTNKAAAVHGQQTKRRSKIAKLQGEMHA